MVCVVCGIEKPLSEFPKKKDTERCLKCRKQHYDRNNRTVHKEKRYARNREYVKNYYRFEQYGLTKDQYEAMLELQEFKCVICKDFLNDKAHIDHDHRCCNSKSQSCGKCIRGLICGSCNRALGLFKDDPEILKAAIVYLAQT